MEIIFEQMELIIIYKLPAGEAYCIKFSLTWTDDEKLQQKSNVAWKFYQIVLPS